MSKFLRLGSNTVESDKGFTVKITHPTYELEYIEGNHVLKVPIEIMVGPIDLHVSTARLRTWSSPAEPITPEQVQEISTRIREALSFMGITSTFS